MLTGIPARLQSALGDRYRIEHQLGRGGMATLYLARDLRHDRHYRAPAHLLQAEIEQRLGN